MPASVDRPGVQELVALGAQLVEVLPRHEYDEEHLPAAISLPLHVLDARSAAVLDPSRPVVVYCWDSLCDMSPRAAWLLERFGFTTYDYTTGKADWLAAGMPTVRQPGREPRVLAAADREPITCGPGESLRSVAARANGSPVVVVTDTNVVVGLLTAEELRGDPTTKAEDSMRLGPTTVRAHEPLDPLVDRMQQRNTSFVLVTTPEGVLLGVFRHRETNST